MTVEKERPPLLPRLAPPRPELPPTRPEVPADPAVGRRLAASRLQGPLLLRFGVRPLFVALDLAGVLAAITVIGGLRPLDLLLPVLVVGLFCSAGLYRSRLSLSVLDDLPKLLGRALAAGAGVASVAAVAGLSDGRLLVTSLLAAPVVAALRVGGYAVVRTLRRRGLVVHPTLLIGAGQVGGQLARVLLDHPECGLHPVGFLDADPMLGPEDRPVPLLGGTEALASVIVEFGVEDVVVAFGSAPESSMVDIIRTCDRLDCEIFFVPRLFEVHATSADMDQVWGMPLVRLRRAAFRVASWRLKRLVDVLVAGGALLLLAPLLGAIALAVRVEGGPGVLFHQERVGLDARPFWLLKFRTLRSVDDVESATRWSIALDDRVGPVGRLLRSTSLDELPQLWNILVGHMSLVGPRPERPHFVAQFTATLPRYTARHRVPSGLTGYAQVHGLRGDTSVSDRARFDNYYIENWSLWVDVKILIRTALTVLRRQGG